MKLYAKTHRMSQVGSLVTFLVTLLISSNAFAVAGFARQTGMSCNQCHTSHGGPTPNFTFVGKKFNGMGYRIPSIRISDIKKGKPEDKGEYLDLKPQPLSGRFQYTLLSNRSNTTTGVWGEAITNPTSRFALFPFIGPIGNNFGMWTEIYIVPLLSAGEWGIASTSNEEFDFRYIFDPDNTDTSIGLALTNQGIREIFGFGPNPGLYSDNNRGGIGGYTHPNRANVLAYGWMHDRWVWAAGAHTGDTNYGWDKYNYLGMFGYAIRNTNDNELWANIYFRTGNDALPLVSRSTISTTTGTWAYLDSVTGVSATRVSGTPYLSEDLTGHNTMDVEIRWAGQDVGPWSYDTVGRLTFSSEDYSDGGKTTRNSWGLAAQVGWKHTYYVKGVVRGRLTYDFTDRLGTEYNIDTAVAYSLWLVYKPVEQFLLYFNYANSQSLDINNPVRANGKRYSIVADISW